MKKFPVVFLLLLLASSLFVMSCASNTTTTTSKAPVTSTTTSTTTSATAPKTTTTSSSPSPTTSSGPKPQPGGNLNIIVIGLLGNLGSPGEGSAVYYPMSAAPAMQDLVDVDRDWNPIITPSTLASSFDISPDGKTITLHLRQGIKFQDGSDFNAEAAKYNLSHYNVAGVVPATLSNVASYNVPDPYTLQIVLKTFDPFFLTTLGRGNPGYMASPAALSINSTAENAPRDHMVGTGAYKFDSWQRDTFVKYTKLSNYWVSGKPYLDSITLTEIADPTTALMSFKAGEGQLISGLSPQQASDLKAVGAQIIFGNTIAPISCLVPNGSDPNSPFSDLRVRQALEYAIDKKAITDSLGYGFQEPATEFASTKDARYVTGLTPRNYDPNMAKQLLTAAGFPNGFKTTIHAANNVDKDYLVAIVTYLQKVNINATLDIVDGTRFNTMYNGGWDGIMVHPSMGATLSGLNQYFGPLKNSTYTYANVYRPDDWLGKLNVAMTEPDAAKRAADEKDLIGEVFNQAMAVPISISTFLAAQTNNLHDLAFGGTSNYKFQPQDGWLSK